MKINILLLCILFVSCEKNITINIIWNTIGNFNNEFIEIDFKKDNKFYNLRLKPNITKKVRLPQGSRYSGNGASSMINYEFTRFPNQITNDLTIEIFVYNPIYEQVGNEYKMEPYEGVEIYWISYIEDGKHYDIFSKDNILTIGNKINENEIYLDSESNDINILMNSRTDINRIFELINTEDIMVFNKHDTFMYNYIHEINCGYIIKSKLNNEYRWLMNIHKW
jgi:hypothetical protein